MYRPAAAFLIPATRQLNLHGCRTPSVERISASLARTKGAYYHRDSSKDDVLIAGFERTIGILLEGQSRAMRDGGDALTRAPRAVGGLCAPVGEPRR